MNLMSLTFKKLLQPRSLYDFPIVVLMCTDFRLFHPFFRREAKKLIAIRKLALISSSDIFSFPMATFMQTAFLSWNLMLALVSSTFYLRSSLWVTTCGNIPILLRMGPNTTGIFLTRVSEARSTWYFLAHFLTSFLSLLKFLRESNSITSISRFLSLASWICLASPMRQTLNLGLGMLGSLTVPANLLSFWGS